MNNCNINVRYVGPGIQNEVALITFDGDINTLPGKQRGVIDAPPQTKISMQVHDATFVADEPVVWISHNGNQPPWIEEVQLAGERELRLIVGGVEERAVAKFVVNIEADGERFTSKDPTIVNDPAIPPPGEGRETQPRP